MTRDANGRFASSSNGGGGAVQNGTVDPLNEYREGLAALIRAKERLEYCARWRRSSAPQRSGSRTTVEAYGDSESGRSVSADCFPDADQRYRLGDVKGHTGF